MQKESFLEKFKGRTENIGKEGFHGLFSINSTAESNKQSTVKQPSKSSIPVKILNPNHHSNHVIEEKIKQPRNETNPNTVNGVRKRAKKLDSSSTSEKKFSHSIDTKSTFTQKSNITNINKDNFQTNDGRLHSSPMGSIFPNNNQFPVINGLSNIAMTNYNYNGFNPLGFYQHNVPYSMMQLYPQGYMGMIPQNPVSYNGVQQGNINNPEFINMYPKGPMVAPQQSYLPYINMMNPNFAFNNSQDNYPAINHNKTNTFSVPSSNTTAVSHNNRNNSTNQPNVTLNKRELDKQRIRLQNVARTENNSVQKNLIRPINTMTTVDTNNQNSNLFSPINLVPITNNEDQLDGPMSRDTHITQSPNELKESRSKSAKNNISKDNYVPYTLKDYKEIEDGLTKLNRGGLGANIGTEDWNKKFEKIQKIKDYSKEVKIKHEKNLKIEFKDPNIEKQNNLKQKIEESNRFKAQLYCKTKLPKLNKTLIADTSANISNVTPSNKRETLETYSNFINNEDSKSKARCKLSNELSEGNQMISKVSKDINEMKAIFMKHSPNDLPMEEINPSKFSKPQESSINEISNLDLSKISTNQPYNNIYKGNTNLNDNEKENEADNDRVNYELSNVGNNSNNNIINLNNIKDELTSKVGVADFNKWDVLNHHEEYQVDSELIQLQKKRQELAGKIEKLKETLI